MVDDIITDGTFDEWKNLPEIGNREWYFVLTSFIRIRMIRTIRTLKQSDRQLGWTDRRTDMTDMPVVLFDPPPFCTSFTRDNETTANRNG